MESSGNMGRMLVSGHIKESGIFGCFKTISSLVYTLIIYPTPCHVLMWLFHRGLQGQEHSPVGRPRLSSEWQKEDVGPQTGNQNSEGKS